MQLNQEKISNFYRLWQTNVANFLEGYIYDYSRKFKPVRKIFWNYIEHIHNFLEDKIYDIEKINLISGLRGVGKTTLLAQLYYLEKFLNENNRNEILNVTPKIWKKIYIDAGKLHLEGISLNDYFKYFEQIEDIKFEKIDKKILILIDEIQYDSQWGLFLKTIYDRTKGNKNIFIIGTGSSALKIKMNPDLYRRSTITDMIPMKFTEYLHLYYKINLTEIETKLSEIFSKSLKIEDIYEILFSMQHKIEKIFSDLQSNIEEKFLETGGFPFLTELIDIRRLNDAIKNIIDRVIISDIISLKRFKSEILSKIIDVLYIVANSDIIDLSKICNSLKINYRSLYAILETLIKSGVLLKISPYGGKYSKVRKSPKYYFTTPTLRYGILNGIIESSIKGKLLEDYVALQLTTLFANQTNTAELLFDTSEKGADFILRFRDGKTMVFEVGFNKEEINQVKNTMKKVNSNLGFVIGSSKLEKINKEILKIPLKIWLMF